jgi:hypothetical protein
MAWAENEVQVDGWKESGGMEQGRGRRAVIASDTSAMIARDAGTLIRTLMTVATARTTSAATAATLATGMSMHMSTGMETAIARRLAAAMALLPPKRLPVSSLQKAPTPMFPTLSSAPAGESAAPARRRPRLNLQYAPTPRSVGNSLRTVTRTVQVGSKKIQPTWTYDLKTQRFAKRCIFRRHVRTTQWVAGCARVASKFWHVRLSS